MNTVKTKFTPEQIGLLEGIIHFKPEREPDVLDVMCSVNGVWANICSFTSDGCHVGGKLADVTTTIEYLEENIAQVRREIDACHNASLEQKMCADIAQLRTQEQRMLTELYSIRPFEIHSNKGNFIVSHKGMFVIGNDGEWLTFNTKKEAQDYIQSRSH